MKSSIFVIAALVMLSGCNSVRYEPESMTPGTRVFAARGGYSMARSIKEVLEKRGYDVIVARNNKTSIGYRDIDVPHEAKYAINVTERSEKLWPFWCTFNGFWWWNFNVSITDQQTRKEIMTWRGRGCANSSMRKLDYILDKMEKKNADTKSDIKRNKHMRNGGIMHI